MSKNCKIIDLRGAQVNNKDTFSVIEFILQRSILSFINIRLTCRTRWWTQRIPKLHPMESNGRDYLSMPKFQWIYSKSPIPTHPPPKNITQQKQKQELPVRKQIRPRPSGFELNQYGQDCTPVVKNSSKWKEDEKHTRLPETEILSNTNQFKYQPMLS